MFNVAVVLVARCEEPICQRYYIAFPFISTYQHFSGVLFKKSIFYKTKFSIIVSILAGLHFTTHPVL